MMKTIKNLIKVLAVDSHPLMAKGIESVLMTNQLYSVHTVFNGRDCLQSARKWNPEIIFLDMDLQDILGIELIDLLRQENPGCRIIIFTDLDPANFLTATLAQGVQGFLRKDCSPDELIEAIMQVDSNQIYISSTLNSSLNPIMSMNGKYNNYCYLLDQLTNREKEILKLMSRGLSNKEMADKIGIKKRTIEYHVSNILSKLGAASRTEAVLIYLGRNPGSATT